MRGTALPQVYCTETEVTAVRGAWGAGSSADGARDESDTILYIGGHASKLCHLALQSTCDETRVCTETGRSMDADLTSETLRY